jgi:predicted MFS family arabinose efflux permease
MATSAGSRWPVVLGYGALCGATQLLWLALAPVTTAAAAHYGVSDGAVGWLAQVFPLVYVVLALPAGAVLDRWPRGGLAAGALLTALAGALRLAGDGYPALLASSVVAAVAQPVVLNAVNQVVGGNLVERHRPVGIALCSAGTFLGMIVALALGAGLPAPAQVPALVRIGAVVALVAGAGTLLLVTRPAPFPPAALAGSTSWGHSLRATWAHPRIRLLSAIVFLGFGVFIALTTWLQVLLAPAGVDGGGSGVLLLTMIVVGIAAAVALPPVVARHGRQSGALQVVGAVTGAGCVLLAVHPGLVTGFLALAPIGAALLPALPIVLEITERADRRFAATGAALIWTAGNAGGLVLALIAQFLLGRPAAVFLLLAVAILAALPLARRLGRAPLPAATAGTPASGPDPATP